MVVMGGVEMVEKDPNAIPLSPVVSSNVDSVGYDEESKQLVVKFKAGGVYAYDSVPAGLHQAMTQAKSVGGFFHQNVKDKFKTTKLK